MFLIRRAFLVLGFILLGFFSGPVFAEGESSSPLRELSKPEAGTFAEDFARHMEIEQARWEQNRVQGPAISSGATLEGMGLSFSLSVKFSKAMKKGIDLGVPFVAVGYPDEKYDGLGIRPQAGKKLSVILPVETVLEEGVSRTWAVLPVETGEFWSYKPVLRKAIVFETLGQAVAYAHSRIVNFWLNHNRALTGQRKYMKSILSGPYKPPSVFVYAYYPDIVTVIEPVLGRDTYRVADPMGLGKQLEVGTFSVALSEALTLLGEAVDSELPETFRSRRGEGLEEMYPGRMGGEVLDVFGHSFWLARIQRFVNEGNLVLKTMEKSYGPSREARNLQTELSRVLVSMAENSEETVYRRDGVDPDALVRARKAAFEFLMVLSGKHEFLGVGEFEKSPIAPAKLDDAFVMQVFKTERAKSPGEKLGADHLQRDLDVFRHVVELMEMTESIMNDVFVAEAVANRSTGLGTNLGRMARYSKFMRPEDARLLSDLKTGKFRMTAAKARMVLGWCMRPMAR